MTDMWRISASTAAPGWLGMPARLRELDVPQEGLDAILDDSMKNFNADPKREFLQHREELRAALYACW